ncbi:MAG TPA: hypothetical protein VIM11_06855 [Tepidisphaeraceae bacterium]|jgi:hypothetical protein
MKAASTQSAIARPESLDGEERLKSIVAERERSQRERSGRISFIARGGSGDITFLWLSPLQSTDETLTLMTRLPELKRLKTGCSITPEGVARLSALRKLTELELRGVSLTEPFAQAICKIEGLEVLRINQSDVMEEGLAALSRLPRLRVLDLQGNRELNDRLFVGIAPMAAVEELDVSHNEELTDVSLAAISRFPKLKLLHVLQSGITPPGIERTLRPGISVSGLKSGQD